MTTPQQTSPKPQTASSPLKNIGALLLFMAAITAALIFVSFTQTLPSQRMKAAQTKSQMQQVIAAAAAYQTEYSQPPAGTGNAELITALTGNNPRKIQFLTVKADDLDSEGRLLDSWGTPFDIKYNGHLEIQSAGPDKKLSTPDDISLE